MKSITELARMWKNEEISTASLKKELEEVELFTPIKFDDSELDPEDSINFQASGKNTDPLILVLSTNK